MEPFSICPDILEVTLRDGSYLIDFQFTAQDTAIIASALQSVGFRWIEIGHGLGLNAGRSGKGRSAASDEQYLEAASETLGSARWGTFFIPGIGREEDLRMAARYHMHFVRIGTNINEIAQAEPFIKLAKDLGFLVSYNGMKSYAVSPEEWGRCAAKAREWGADIACLVDSAGSMYPEEVSQYLRSARAQSDTPLGFHGHDNLSLSMANTLRAIEEGAVLVDTSLQGMGRSAGNAITEVLVAILKQRGLLPGIEMKPVMDIGAALIRPLLGHRGVDPMAVTGGFARFHSSFTPKVVAYAQKHGVDVRDLIVRLCQEDLISAPDELLERLGRELANDRLARPVSIPVSRVPTQRPADGAAALAALVDELRPCAIKTGKFSVLNAVIGEAPQDRFIVSGNIQETVAHVAGSVTYTTDAQLEAILECAEGKVDVLFLDVDRKPFGPTAPATMAAKKLRKTVLLTYLDSRIWVAAVEDQAARLLGENLSDATIVIAGDNPKSRLLAADLLERRAHVALLTRQADTKAENLRAFSFTPSAGALEVIPAGTAAAAEALATARLVIAWPGEAPWFGRAEAAHVRVGTYVVDAGIGALLPEAIQDLQERGALLVRFNMWPALAGALVAVHETQRVCTQSMGRATLGGVPVVSGGAMGMRGDVVIDNVREPSRIIGVADGRGGLLFQYDAQQGESVRRVAEEIQSRVLAPLAAMA